MNFSDIFKSLFRNSPTRQMLQEAGEILADEVKRLRIENERLRQENTSLRDGLQLISQCGRTDRNDEEKSNIIPIHAKELDNIIPIDRTRVRIKPRIS